MRCVQCQKEFPLKDFVQYMDEELETFLEASFCDRI